MQMSLAVTAAGVRETKCKRTWQPVLPRYASRNKLLQSKTLIKYKDQYYQEILLVYATKKGVADMNMAIHMLQCMHMNMSLPPQADNLKDKLDDNILQV